MVPRLELPWQAGGDVAVLRSREWLVTNGLGGYASGTLLGVPTRRYHGLFVPNLPAPAGRHVLVGRYDEDMRASTARVRLGGAERAGGPIESDAALCLQSFFLDGLVPVWRYAVGDAIVERSIVMPHGRQTVCVHYRLLSGSTVALTLRPYAVFRRHDLPLHDKSAPTIETSAHDDWVTVSSPAHALAVRMVVRGRAPEFVSASESAEALYLTDRDRGYDHLEYGISPGYFTATLQDGVPVTLTVTISADAEQAPDGEAILAEEHTRAAGLLERAPAAADDFSRRLVLAADQFLVCPASRSDAPSGATMPVDGQSVYTVIAGYHWFVDWGRDTMISLEGLTLRTGRPHDAAAILRTFARYVRDGLLPNLFPEGTRQARYNTMDATLWFFQAIERYVRATADTSIVNELRPVLIEIVEHHLAGTLYGIGADPSDGLLRGGAPGVALTWMDAKFEDWVVTPRRGKPVEIQALWYNALALMSDWVGTRPAGGGPYAALAARAQASFNEKFWNERAGALFDVIDGPEGDEANLRPNQIFALSLTHPVLAPHRWHAVLDAVSAALLTPYGLRTLSPASPNYCRDYHGDLRTRDAAYHQGTVWPWLIGHFVDAWLRIHGDRRFARRLLGALPAHLLDAGMGTISEIFDADAPYRPRGCIAQAWSVAEVLRAWDITREPEK